METATSWEEISEKLDSPAVFFWKFTKDGYPIYTPERVGTGLFDPIPKKLCKLVESEKI